MPNLDVSWVTAPPVVEVRDKDLFTTLCSKLESESKFFKLRSKVGDNEITRWNKRIGRAREIVHVASKWANSMWDEEGQGFFAYILCGMPIGIMVTSDEPESKTISIEFLAAHPGSEGGGGILIEHAVNLSEKAGYEGRLELESFTKASTAAYLALGFAKEAGQRDKMTLSPGKSNEKWVKLDTGWCLRKYKIRKTFAA